VEEFQAVQKVTVERCREFVAKAQEAVDDFCQSPPGASDSAPEVRPEASPPIPKRPQSSLQIQDSMDALRLQNEIAYNEDLIREREQGLLEIEESMADLYEITCSMQVVTGQQQEMIDNIEANMEAAAVRTRGAVRELVTARDRQRKRRGNIFCLLFLALFILVMALAIVNAIF